MPLMTTGVVQARQTVDAVERICADATSADEMLEGLAGELQRAVPYDAAAWFGIDPVTLLASAPSRVENLDAELCSMFWHLEFHEQDFANFVDLAQGDGVSALRLSLDDRPARSIRYREFMAPQGFEDELRAVFRVGDSIWGVRRLLPRVGDPALRGRGRGADHERHQHHRRLAAQPRPRDEPVAGPADGARPAGDRSARSRGVEQRGSEGLAARPLALLGNDCGPVESLDLADLRAGDMEVPTPLYALVARAQAVADGRERVPARLRLRDRVGAGSSSTRPR